MNLLASLPGSPWWELVIAGIGAVIGALAGGVPAYLLAIRSTKISAEKEVALKLEAQDDRCYRLFLLIRTMLNDALVTKRYIDEMMQRPMPSDEKHPVQKRVSAFANLQHRDFVRLDVRDLALFKSQNGLDFQSGFSEATDRYNAVIDSLRTYAELRKEHQDFVLEIGEHKIEDGDLISSKYPTSQRGKVLVLEARLETVIAPTVEHLDELCRDLLKIAEEFSTRIEDELKRKPGIPSFSADEIASIRAQFGLE